MADRTVMAVRRPAEGDGDPGPTVVFNATEEQAAILNARIKRGKLEKAPAPRKASAKSDS